jgi:hypothetical protein
MVDGICAEYCFFDLESQTWLWWSSNDHVCTIPQQPVATSHERIRGIKDETISLDRRLRFIVE